MRITPEGSDQPFPGLDKPRFALDTEADPLGLAAVRGGAGVWGERCCGMRPR